MKRKKLSLNKTTVSNLRTHDMSGVRGGYRPTENSCAISQGCLTDHEICNSGLAACECSVICTRICPIYITDPPDCY